MPTFTTDASGPGKGLSAAPVFQALSVAYNVYRSLREGAARVEVTRKEDG